MAELLRCKFCCLMVVVAQWMDILATEYNIVQLRDTRERPSLVVEAV